MLFNKDDNRKRILTKLNSFQQLIFQTKQKSITTTARQFIKQKEMLIHARNLMEGGSVHVQKSKRTLTTPYKTHSWVLQTCKVGVLFLADITQQAIQRFLPFFSQFILLYFRSLNKRDSLSQFPCNRPRKVCSFFAAVCSIVSRFHCKCNYCHNRQRARKVHHFFSMIKEREEQ